MINTQFATSYSHSQTVWLVSFPDGVTGNKTSTTLCPYRLFGVVKVSHYSSRQQADIGLGDHGLHGTQEHTQYHKLSPSQPSHEPPAKQKNSLKYFSAILESGVKVLTFTIICALQEKTLLSL